MGAFSRPQYMKNILKHQIQRTITLAGGNQKGASPNPDFAIKHVNEVKDAANKNFTMLIKRVTEDFNKNQLLQMKRRAKLVGK